MRHNHPAELATANDIELLALQRFQWTPFRKIAREATGEEEGEWTNEQNESRVRKGESEQLWWVFLSCLIVIVFFVVLFIVMYGMKGHW